MIKSAFVSDFLRDNGAIYWRLRYQNEKGNMLTSYPTESESPTMDGSLSYFEKILSRLLPGRYFIEAWQTEGQKKEWCKTFFNVEGTGQNQEKESLQNYLAGIGNIPSNESIEDKITNALNDYKKDQEIETLRAKIVLLESEKKELELEVNSAQTKIMKRLSPYLPELMEGLGFAKSSESVSGTGEIDTESETLSTTLKEWYDLDNEMPDLIEKIVQIAKTNKGTYTMAKNMLMQQ
jgi:hypothetical protein